MGGFLVLTLVGADGFRTLGLGKRLLTLSWFFAGRANFLPLPLERWRGREPLEHIKDKLLVSFGLELFSSPDDPDAISESFHGRSPSHFGH